MSVLCLQLFFSTPQSPNHHLVQVYLSDVQLFLNSLFVIFFSILICMSEQNKHSKGGQSENHNTTDNNYLPLSHGFTGA